MHDFLRAYEKQTKVANFEFPSAQLVGLASDTSHAHAERHLQSNDEVAYNHQRGGSDKRAWCWERQDHWMEQWASSGEFSSRCCVKRDENSFHFHSFLHPLFLWGGSRGLPRRTRSTSRFLGIPGTGLTVVAEILPFGEVARHSELHEFHSCALRRKVSRR